MLWVESQEVLDLLLPSCVNMSGSFRAGCPEVIECGDVLCLMDFASVEGGKFGS